MRFRVIEFPKPNTWEKVSGLISVIIFVACAISFLYEKMTLTIFLFFLLIIYIIIFNVFTKNKFEPYNIVKRSEKYIEFNENGFTINGKTIKWNDARDIEISIKCYKDKVSRNKDIRNTYLKTTPIKSHRLTNNTTYKGYELNFIELKSKEEKREFCFLIENEEDYEQIKDYFKSTILPKLYRLKNIKFENILIQNYEFRELREFKEKYGIRGFYDEIQFD